MAEKSNEPFVIERAYDATADKVWHALTNNEAMKKWYFKLPEFRAEVDFAFEFFGGPPEKQYLHKCKITEVIPGKKLSHTWRYDGYLGDSLVTFELFPEGNKMRVKLTHSDLDTFAANNNSDFDKKNFATGWTSIIGKSLKEYVEGEDTSDKEFIITRILKAPRELVFEAYTNPEHIAKWFGPRIFTATADAELRKGGTYRYTMIGTDEAPPEFKGPYLIKGEYLEFIRPEKIVQTTDLTDQPDDWKEMIKSKIVNYNGQDFLHSEITVVFEEIEKNKTKITITEKFDSDAVRDAYGKEGWTESLDRLEELLAE